MLESALVAALSASAPLAVAGGLVVKALNSEPAKALYSQVALYLGPWHERRALMMKADSFQLAIEKVRRKAGLTDEERRLLNAALLGSSPDTPALEPSDRVGDRAVERLRAEAIQEQANMEAIVASCLDRVTASGATLRNVDPDWFSDFFDACRRVTNVDVREMWATILEHQTTGEGNLSKRALEALRLFDRRDGEVLQAIARYTIKFSESEAMPVTPIRPLMHDDDLKRAQTIGVVTEIAEMAFVPRPVGTRETLRLSDGSDLVLVWSRPQPSPPKYFYAWVTPLGKELLTVVDREPDMAFLKSLGQMLRSLGVEAHHGRRELDQALGEAL